VCLRSHEEKGKTKVRALEKSKTKQMPNQGTPGKNAVLGLPEQKTQQNGVFEEGGVRGEKKDRSSV